MNGVRFAATLLGCAIAAITLPGVDNARAGEAFTHTIDGTTLPWTDKPFDDPAEQFRFVIHSDLTGGERPEVFDVAVAQINLLRPAFIINVGDLISGTDDRAEVDRHWARFGERANKARAPLFHVGGNHDLLGLTMREAWKAHHGPRYYHFVYRNTLFLVLDTEDHSPERLEEIAGLRGEAFDVAAQEGWDAFAQTPYALLPENAAGNISSEQADYIVKAIEDNPDVQWTFLFMHKAPWLRENETSFPRIETALSGKAYTAFHGHKHAYQYQQRNGGDYIQLATTGGVFLPENGRSMDQLVLVTVDSEGADIANLLMEGVLDKTGEIPLDGQRLCLDSAHCPAESLD